jgi:uncharacterized protein (TIGR01777 family)
MRVGITGSSGLIGSALVSALRARDNEVVRFVRPTSASDGEPVIRWDPSRQLVDEGDLRRVGGFDAVVHLAGAGIADRRWTTARKQEILTSRTSATSLLVGALGSMATGTPILASGSAIGYYGSRGDEVLDETSSPGDDFLAGVCAAWEAAAAPIAQRGTVVASLRTGIVMSDRGGALKKQLPLFRLGLGGALSSGRQWLSPISLNDEVRAILWVLDHRLAGPVNLVAPQPLTNADFTKSLARLVRRGAWARVPAFALKIALGDELATEAVLASQRVLPKVLLDSGFTFDSADITSILHAATQHN